MRFRPERKRKLVRLPRLPGAEAAPAPDRMLGSFLLGAAVGAGLAYAFDPTLGRRRRRQARDRLIGVTHRTGKRVGRKLRVTVAQGRGHVQGLAHRLRPGPVEELDDVTLAHKVESIVFRDPRVPKGQISVNAEDGCVFLRGQVEPPELVADLEAAVRKIRGVKDVENLLHGPGTPAPVRRPRSRQPGQ